MRPTFHDPKGLSVEGAWARAHDFFSCLFFFFFSFFLERERVCGEGDGGGGRAQGRERDNLK